MRKSLAYRETCGKRRIVDGEPFRQTLAQHCGNIGILGARSMDARRFCLQNHEGMGIDCVDIRKCGMSVDARAACLDTVNALHTRLANRLFGQGKAIGDHSRVRDCSAGGGRIICNEEIDRLLHVADTTCQQADGVEARRERHRAGARNDAIGRLPGGNAAAIRRDA